MIAKFYSFRRIMYSDLQTISPEQYMKQITARLTDIHAVSVSALMTLPFSSYKTVYKVQGIIRECKCASKFALPLLGETTRISSGKYFKTFFAR